MEATSDHRDPPDPLRALAFPGAPFRCVFGADVEVRGTAVERPGAVDAGLSGSYLVAFSARSSGT
jgi:hypothetical protein